MSFKEQIDKLKSNWLLIVLGLIIFVILFSITQMSVGSVGYQSRNLGASEKVAMDYDMELSQSLGGGVSSSRTDDFSPDVEERKIIKNTNLKLNIKRGEFENTNSRIKAISNTSDSFILSENITSRKSGSKELFTGRYTIKVDSTKLEDMTSQLKDLGKVTYLNQSGNDITGNYTKTSLEIELEKERLKRYQEIYDSTNEDGKLRLIDRIFNQERRIKYLEDSLKNMDQRVEYSTISLTVTETYNYANIVLVRFSDLVRTFVNNVNNVLKFIFGVVPYAVAVYLIYLFTRLFKRRKNVNLKIKNK